VPIVLTARGASAWTAGLVLTALPAGFALAATTAGVLLPHRWRDRGRAIGGAALCAAALLTLLVLPLGPVILAPVLAVIGIGLGLFTPSNNTMIMGAVPPTSAGTGGGLLNMTRGVGTALGVGLVTLALHVGAHGDPGIHLAIGILAGAALLAGASGYFGASHRSRRPVGG
jgi:MFS family permease